MPDKPLIKKPVGRNAWLAAGVLFGGALYLWYRHSQAKAAAAAGSDIIGSTAGLPSTMPGGAGNSSTDFSTPVAAPVSLQEWMGRVQTWANSLGYDAATTQSALQTYGLGNCLPTAQYAIINQALGLFGMPPQAPYQGVVQCAPFVAPPTDPPPPTTTTPPPPTPTLLAPFWRLIAPGGQHFWTTSQDELRNLEQSGWKVEGVASWVNNAAAANLVPLRRLLNPKTGEHFWTTSQDEINFLTGAGWTLEGAAGYVSNTQTAGTIPLLRLLNPTTGAHFWTSDQNEANSLTASGKWKVEGPAAYVPAQQQQAAAA